MHNGQWTMHNGGWTARTQLCIVHCALCIVFITALLTPELVFAASEPCSPPNVIPASVCDMDSFYGDPPRQIPQGWTPFVLSGDLTFMQDVDTLWGAPSLRMWSNGGTFKAGIFTQVQVTPGAGYRASVAWAAPNEPDAFGRQLGIDPTGGTDPNGGTVVWGATHWGPGRLLNYPPGKGPNIDLTVRAQSEVITVFFVTDHNRSTGDNVIFVDAIALYPDESAPAAGSAHGDPCPCGGCCCGADCATHGHALAAHPHPHPHRHAHGDPVPHGHGDPDARCRPPTPTVTPRWTPLAHHHPGDRDGFVGFGRSGRSTSWVDVGDRSVGPGRGGDLWRIIVADTPDKIEHGFDGCHGF